jgi:uncharacterized protein DUF6789
MDTVGKGVVAGFIAMLALSLLLDPLVLLTRSRGAPEPAPGLQLHFFLGPVVWGAVFAFFHDHMGGPSWLRGIVFAVGTWIIITVALLVTVGASRLGVTLGLMAVAASLLVHVVYGAVLGAIYGALGRDESAGSVHDDCLRPIAH